MKKLPIILLLSFFTNSIQAQSISDIDEIIRLCRDTYANCKTYQDKAIRVSTVYDSHNRDTQTIVRFETYYDKKEDKFKFINTVSENNLPPHQSDTLIGIGDEIKYKYSPSFLGVNLKIVDKTTAGNSLFTISKIPSFLFSTENSGGLLLSEGDFEPLSEEVWNDIPCYKIQKKTVRIRTEGTIQKANELLKSMGYESPLEDAGFVNELSGEMIDTDTYWIRKDNFLIVKIVSISSQKSSLSKILEKITEYETKLDEEIPYNVFKD